VPRKKSRRVRLFDRQRGRCAITGLSMQGAPTHIDHIVPRSAGGSSADDNLQLVLRSANMAKGCNTTAWVREWLLTAAQSIQDSNLATRS
jgi:5-methylcytosine-specific restriction endonuclease McrA